MSSASSFAARRSPAFIQRSNKTSACSGWSYLIRSASSHAVESARPVAIAVFAFAKTASSRSCLDSPSISNKPERPFSSDMVPLSFALDMASNYQNPKNRNNFTYYRRKRFSGAIAVSASTPRKATRGSWVGNRGDSSGVVNGSAACCAAGHLPWSRGVEKAVACPASRKGR